MNYTLLFFIFASAVLILSIVSICVAPLINGFLMDNDNWGTLNCDLLSDKYNYDKSRDDYPTEKAKEKKVKEDKSDLNQCKRKKAMYGLEYSSLTCDIVAGVICSILGLLHYLEIGKKIEKKTGLIGIISGSIGFILTFIYIGFSGYIYTNDSSSEVKLFPNGSYLKYNGVRYVPPYDIDKEEEDPYIKYATYIELGQKQYNYDSELYKSSIKTDSEYYNCQDDNYGNIYIKRHYNNDLTNPKECDYIWKIDNLNDGILNKYTYNRCITTFILNIFILISFIGLILFGFFLFKNLGEINQGGVPIPMSSVNDLDNKKD